MPIVPAKGLSGTRAEKENTAGVLASLSYDQSFSAASVN
jgi:hypothetical protein